MPTYIVSLPGAEPPKSPRTAEAEAYLAAHPNIGLISFVTINCAGCELSELCANGRAVSYQVLSEDLECGVGEAAVQVYQEKLLEDIADFPAIDVVAAAEFTSDITQGPCGPNILSAPNCQAVPAIEIHTRNQPPQVHHWPKPPTQGFVVIG